MIKKLLTIFLITVICICSSISASAYTEQYIFDYEGSLSYSEIEELESTAQQIENEYGYCVMFCITDEETDENHAQNIYDTYTDNENLLSYDDAVIEDDDTDVYTTDNEANSSKSPVKTIILCIVVGMAMGFIIIFAIASKNKSVRMQKNATVYTRPGSFVLTGSYDNFLYKNLDKTPKPKQENKN